MGVRRVLWFAGLAEMSETAADLVVERAVDTVAATGAFYLALAGGSTPKILYRLLATPPRRGRMPWAAVRIFLGDERLVGSEHRDSNWRMAWETLLGQVPLPADQLFPVPTTAGTPAEVAARYAEILEGKARHRIGFETLLFDLVLLGMGKDGHTASLFPGDTRALASNAMVVAVGGETADPRVARVSLTLAALSQCRDVLFLISGREKIGLVEGMLADGNRRRYPAGMVRPRGRVDWLLAEGG